jgi:hypothetical protein
MTWSEYEARLEGIRKDWEVLEGLTVEKWLTTQNKALVPIIESGGSWVTDALAIIGDTAEKVVKPALTTSRLLLSAIVESAGGPDLDNGQWSPSIDLAGALTRDGDSRLNEVILTLAAQSVFLPSASGFNGTSATSPVSIPTWFARPPSDGGAA